MVSWKPPIEAVLLDQYGLSLPVDLRGLADALGIEVVSFPFNGRIREIIIGRAIGVRRGVSRRWFRWYVVHAIGHHQMHVGTSFYLQDLHRVAQAKVERQAEDLRRASCLARKAYIARPRRWLYPRRSCW